MLHVPQRHLTPDEEGAVIATIYGMQEERRERPIHDGLRYDGPWVVQGTVIGHGYTILREDSPACGNSILVPVGADMEACVRASEARFRERGAA